MEINNIQIAYASKHQPIPKFPLEIDPRSVSVGDNPEMLISISQYFKVDNVYNSFSDVPHREQIFLRTSVIEKLIKANSLLPRNFSLVIFDGHRNMDFQKALLAHYLKLNPELQKGYVSDPKDEKLVPPHTTGGAVDLTLAYKENILDLGTPYDSFEKEAWVDALEGTEKSETEASQFRRMLYHAMIGAGFAPYPMEWWHWSYGDQWWAAFYGKDTSLYNSVEHAY